MCLLFKAVLFQTKKSLHKFFRHDHEEWCYFSTYINVSVSILVVLSILEKLDTKNIKEDSPITIRQMDIEISKEVEISFSSNEMLT